MLELHYGVHVVKPMQLMRGVELRWDEMGCDGTLTILHWTLLYVRWYEISSRADDEDI